MMTPALQLWASRWLVWPAYAVILLAACYVVQSTSGWIVLGLAPVLWLDRHVLRRNRWGPPARLGAAILVRLAFLVTGALFVSRLGHGRISVAEAVFLGTVLSMVLFVLEVIFDLAVGQVDRIVGVHSSPGKFRFRNLGVMLLLFLPLFYLAPLGIFHPVSKVPTQTPGALGLAYQDVRLRTADGLELPAWFVPAADPVGSVIFCHGHGSNRQHCFHNLKALHELGLNVLAFDFRGTGASPGHTVTFGGRDVPDVLAAEAFLVERVPAQPLFVLGVSYGAAVSLQALPRLHHVRAAWLESPYARLGDVAHNRFANLAPSIRGPLILSYSTVAWLDTGYWPLDAKPIDCLDRISVPLCFCHGVKDGLIPFAQAEELYARYRGPKTCYWVEGAGHGNLPFEGGPEYLGRLRGFFRDQLGQSPSPAPGPTKPAG
jgi:fermentation-respiration switch protein FrsA (DUF1100 family)